METGTSRFDALVVQPVQSLLNQVMAFLPTVLGAIILFLAGWIVAKVIEGLVIKVLKTVGLDKLADQTNLSGVLSKGGIKRKLTELVGAIVYWLVMLAVVMVAFNALQLTVAAELFQQVVAFLPNVVAAVFIFIVGVFAAAFLSATVRTAASNAGIVQSHLLGQLTQAIVIIFAGVAALQQLQIQFVGDAFLIILAGLSLGSALAFGLGCRDIAGRWVSELIDEIQARRR